MRMGEILSLSWRGVDLTRRTVMLFHSKNGERRTIPMNQTVLSLIKGHKEAAHLIKQPAGNLINLNGENHCDLVFRSKVSTPIESGHLRRSFRLALKKAKIEDFHFHDLRHTFATRLVQAGVDLYKVQRLFGHKSPMMTQRMPTTTQRVSGMEWKSWTGSSQHHTLSQLAQVAGEWKL